MERLLNLFLRWGWGRLLAHHELADPGEIFDVVDRAVPEGTALHAYLGGAALLAIPLALLGLMLWRSRSRPRE